jgi:SHS family lactate transporter-like MFS transporter
MSNKDTANKDVGEVEQVESVYSKELNNGEDRSFEQYQEKQKKKNIFIRFKDSIYSKPEKTHNAWHLLTNLTNTQRITFAAGKVLCILYSITCTHSMSGIAFFGWTLDAFDFFSVSLSATRIGKTEIGFTLYILATDILSWE